MSKIICDICGTTYPDTADQCPICGCSRDAAAELAGDDILLDGFEDDPKGRGGRFTAKKKKEIFDFDEVNSDGTTQVLPEDEDDSYNPYEEEEEYPQEPRANTGVVIVLTVLIAVLLLAAGFLFVRFFLPNMGGQEQQPVTEPVVQTTAATEDLSVPCLGLTMTSARVAELSQPGAKFLIHVTTSPSDTTDPLLFTSLDESIATVTEDGRIEAVSEGQTVIQVSCGAQVIDVEVTVKFVEETVPPTQAPTEPQTVEGETPAEPAEGETAPANTGLKDVTLKLKQTDFRLGVYYEYQLLLDCGLEQNEVQWTSEHPHIATVDENGVVKAIKSGTTSVTAKYGDQEVSCIVRCF